MGRDYKEKLRDPRWQKKRLEILEKDGWLCQSCFVPEQTLNVHHKIYNKSDPWDIDNDFLISLCDGCHEEETNTMREITKCLIREIKKNFLSSEISSISLAFNSIKMVDESHIVSNAIYYLFSDEEKMKNLISDYLISNGVKNGKSV